MRKAAQLTYMASCQCHMMLAFLKSADSESAIGVVFSLKCEKDTSRLA